MMLHNLLDYYKFNCRKSEYMKIRHCLIDQATTRLLSGRCLIDLIKIWQLPDLSGSHQSKIRTRVCEMSRPGCTALSKKSTNSECSLLLSNSIQVLNFMYTKTHKKNTFWLFHCFLKNKKIFVKCSYESVSKEIMNSINCQILYL